VAKKRNLSSPGLVKKRRAIAKRRARVEEMYLAGVPNYEIAERLDVTTSVVSRDLKVVEDDYKNRQMVSRAGKVQAQLGRIGRIELEAWKSFHRSVGMIKKRVLKYEDVKDAHGKVVRDEDGIPMRVPQLVEEREEFKAGDAAFLNTLVRCAQERAQIEGTYAPTRAVEELYLGVDEVFSDDTVAEEERRMKEILAKISPVRMDALSGPETPEGGEEEIEVVEAESRPVERKSTSTGIA